jgi:uncharacterized protein
LILVDANLLLYAENRDAPEHGKAREWWDDQLSGAAPVCLCWPVLSAFLRIATNRRVYARPLSLDEATARVNEWLAQPCVRVVNPTENHWATFREMLRAGKAVGNLVADAHLAALAVEHGCLLCSTDADFRRFPKLKCCNPLES